MACAGEAARRPAVECYRPRQMTVTDDRQQKNTGPLYYVYNNQMMFMVNQTNFHLVNADSAPGGRQSSDQANRLGLEVCR